MTRLTGGLIDRSRSLNFTFDGKVYTGHAGDTLASALLANDVRLMGRSFKYHRPRGVLTAGSEEPNALVELRSGAWQEPNTRATVAELFDGLEARSQNRVGSLAFDLLAVNDLLSPFLAAGFYDKTFMWPRAFWERVYEPMIRRAAGLGRLTHEADPDSYDAGFLHCNLLVIGGGAAGLAAALTAARAGAQVILADEDFRLGGRLLAERAPLEQPSPDWIDGVQAEFASLPNLRVMRRTTVWGRSTMACTARSNASRTICPPPAGACANRCGASPPSAPFWQRARRNGTSPLPITTAPALCWRARCGPMPTAGLSARPNASRSLPAMMTATAPPPIWPQRASRSSPSSMPARMQDRRSAIAPSRAGTSPTARAALA